VSFDEIQSPERRTAPCAELPRCNLRRSLPAEYLSLGLMMHAGFGALVWGICSFRTPSALLLVAAGIWIVGRAVGAFAQSGFTLLVSSGLIVALVTLRSQEIAAAPLGLAMISKPVFLAMLGIVLLLDAIEFATSPTAVAAGRRLRSWNWHRIAVWGFGLAFLIYMVVIPTTGWVVERMQPPKSGRILLEDMTLAEHVRLRSMEAMTALWFFSLGATIGSFLNVVAYRLPRGESVVLRRSRCPQCGTQIKGRDNVPILGWLLLGGRCRACRMAISSRYPVVESIAAVIFLSLYFVELISGGANIPLREPNPYHGVVWIIFYTKWDLVGLYLFHCFAASSLLAWTLIGIDRQRLPWRAPLVVGVVLCGLPLLWPHLLPIPAMRDSAFGFAAPSWLSAVATSAVGGVSGALLGCLVAHAILVRGGQHDPVQMNERGEHVSLPASHLPSAGMIVGLSVGWQAAAGVWLLTLALWPVTLGITRWKLREPPATAVLLIAYLIHLIGWRWLTVGWWPSAATGPIGWAALSLGFAALWLLNRSLSRRRRSTFAARDDARVYAENTQVLSDPSALELAASSHSPTSFPQGRHL